MMMDSSDTVIMLFLFCSLIIKKNVLVIKYSIQIQIKIYIIKTEVQIMQIIYIYIYKQERK
jgi:hypothetical protein